MAGVEGIDAPALTGWLQQHADLTVPLRFERLPGGRSNLTVLVTDATGRRAVVRRPPLGSVLESAHDMGREHRFLTALAATRVPVPEVIGFEPDPEITGAPFLVMTFVDGVVVRDVQDVGRHLAEPVRSVATDRLVDTLATLHDVAPESIGLHRTADRDGYVSRQLRRWWQQLAGAGIRPPPLLAEVHGCLTSAPPESDQVTVVHGDYRLDNLVLDPLTGAVRAVLDWELATLGDPLADLGLLLVYWSWPDAATRARIGFPSDAAGFPDGTHLVARYARRTGRDVTDVDGYVAFGYWKLACILAGVHHRRRAGAYGTAVGAPDVDDGGLAGDPEVVTQLAQLAADAAAAAGR